MWFQFWSFATIFTLERSFVGMNAKVLPQCLCVVGFVATQITLKMAHSHIIDTGIVRLKTHLHLLLSRRFHQNWNRWWKTFTILLKFIWGQSGIFDKSFVHFSFSNTNPQYKHPSAASAFLVQGLDIPSFMPRTLRLIAPLSWQFSWCVRLYSCAQATWSRRSFVQLLPAHSATADMTRDTQMLEGYKTWFREWWHYHRHCHSGSCLFWTVVSSGIEIARYTGCAAPILVDNSSFADIEHGHSIVSNTQADIYVDSLI